MASVSLLKVDQPRERSCLGSGMDKDLRQGTDEGLVRRPKSLTKTDYKALPTGQGLFEAGCQQRQEGSAFPDDGLCSRPTAGSGAGRVATGCSLGRPFIPAPSAAARPTRAANPRPRVAVTAGPGA